jgi:hypothetical protein
VSIEPRSSLKLGLRFFFFFLRLCVFESCKKQRPSFTRSRHLGPSLKLDSGFWDRVLNSVPTSYYYIVLPAHFSFIFLQPTIFSKSLLLLLQELPTESVFLDRSRTDLYSPLSSHQYCKIFFYLDY